MCFHPRTTQWSPDIKPCTRLYKSISYSLVAGSPYSLMLYAVDVVLMAHHRPDVFPVFQTECMHLLIAAPSVKHRTACLFIVCNDHRVNVWLFK